MDAAAPFVQMNQIASPFTTPIKGATYADQVHIYNHTAT